MGVPRWTPEQLEAEVGSGGAVLAELRAEWCTQCGAQENVVTRLVGEYEGRVAIGALDLGEHPGAADRYGVSGLPAFLLFSRGTHHGTIGGFRRAPELREMLRELLTNGGKQADG